MFPTSILSAHDIDFVDYGIFLMLQSNHLASAKQIADQIGVSTETVRLRIQKLKNRGILRREDVVHVPLLGERKRTELEYAYVPSKLGLQRIHLFIHGIPDKSKLLKILELCEEHPYTHYRSVTYSNGLSLYAQFDIPPDTEPLLMELLESVKEQELFADYLPITSNYNAKSKVDIYRWDIKNQSWRLTENDSKYHPNPFTNLWHEFLDTMYVEGVGSLEEFQVKPEMAFEMDKLDALLLRELTVNAKINFRELGKIYDRDSTTLSRRVKRLKEKIALETVLYYDHSLFNLEYVQLIVGTISNHQEFNKLSALSFVLSGALPFESSLVINENKYLWFIATPPNLASSFSEFNWEFSPNMKVYQLHLPKARTYYFYHLNYLGNMKWNENYEYFVTTPLHAIGIKK